MQSCKFILLLSLLSLYSCISLGLFASTFYKEIQKFKYEITNDYLDRALREYYKKSKIGKESTLKNVDLAHIMETCHLDFEIDLVESFWLPASDHQIGHISIGGDVIPGQTPHFQNYWKATIGVVLENTVEPNHVYSLLYHLTVDFNKYAFETELGVSLDIDELDLVHAIFYNLCLQIYYEELLPVKDDPAQEEVEQKGNNLSDLFK